MAVVRLRRSICSCAATSFARRAPRTFSSLKGVAQSLTLRPSTSPCWKETRHEKPLLHDLQRGNPKGGSSLPPSARLRAMLPEVLYRAGEAQEGAAEGRPQAAGDGMTVTGRRVRSVAAFTSQCQNQSNFDSASAISFRSLGIQETGRDNFLSNARACKQSGLK